MTLTIPCGRLFPARDDERIVVACKDGDLCPHCGAIRILRATCLGVADRLESTKRMSQPRTIWTTIDESVGRLRADVARVEGRAE